MAYVVEHWTMMQKVGGSSLTWADSWKTSPVHPGASGYLTLAGKGQQRERERFRPSYAVP